MYSIGYDIGSSFVKAAIVEVGTGRHVVSGSYPETEMPILAPRPGWAEQNPEVWWDGIKILTQQLLSESKIKPADVRSIGITYQMHGLVAVDKKKRPVRPAIIWCDSRAVEIGEKAFLEIGKEYCLKRFLNSPGNFTASKLRWVIENEPGVAKNIWQVLLPGDYIALKMTGMPSTTISGLSEGIFWDYKKKIVSPSLLDYYDIDVSLLPASFPSFGVQGYLSTEGASALGLKKGTPLCYRAGDQPNNAYSLGVLESGQVAATAGTSGVIYAVSNQLISDTLSRVNQFAHVNYSSELTRIGILLCLNGTGILYSWLRKNFGGAASYEAMNKAAAKIPPGSDGLLVLPFGNGSERVLENKQISASFHGLDFNRHGKEHVFRAAQEGIVFALTYGMKIIEQMGMMLYMIRAGHTNMFLSDVFAQTLADCAGTAIFLYDTDGAQGAARGAAFGAGFYKTIGESLAGLREIKHFEPRTTGQKTVREAYRRWEQILKAAIEQRF